MENKPKDGALFLQEEATEPEVKQFTQSQWSAIQPLSEIVKPKPVIVRRHVGKQY